MERLKERLDIAARALETLKEIGGTDLPFAVKRDAAITRFVYTFEAVWKTAQLFLELVDGVSVGAPKPCIRAARTVDLLSDENAEAALEMTNDRNLTVHTYNEKLANEIFGRLPQHIEVLTTWLEAMKKRVECG